MALSNIAGFPRIGPNRELKFATEGYWRGEVSRDDLLATAKRIRLDNWRFMQQAGVDLIPSNDFSLYDHVLDTIALVGAVPERYQHSGGHVGIDTYFAQGRGPGAGPALRGQRRNRHLLRDGPRTPGGADRCHRDGDDEVVRHELPLH